MNQAVNDHRFGFANCQKVSLESYDLCSNINNYQEDYLRKTIDIKNKNIDELLRELRETKELYQEYKNQYINQEKRIKIKLNDITAKLDVQTSELERLKHMNGKMKQELQAAHEKEQKIMEVHASHVKEINQNYREMEGRVKDLIRQNGNLKDKNQLLVGKLTKTEEKIKNGESELAAYREELKCIREEMLIKQHKWNEEKKQITDKINDKEKLKNQKVRMNEKLSHLQHKIKDTLRKI